MGCLALNCCLDVRVRFRFGNFIVANARTTFLYISNDKIEFIELVLVERGELMDYFRSPVRIFQRAFFLL